MNEPQAGFEERLARLRQIVDELERGELPLEKSIERYEEGVRVLKHCAETLANARLRVEELSRDAEGVLETRPAKDLEEDAEEDEEN
ncbi:MAG: exodeoxyribonuclease VII small subunit [Planctomycetes bacterium]|nr:exodeoxyribonuclease VII small subunit [Planctomycetota bacterium]